MIAVIADDLSGSAELAGIGLEFGFTVEVSSKPIIKPGADLLVLNTATRSKSAQAAYHTIKKIIRSVINLQPEWMYKKTDSVLRGNVLSEIEAILEITGQTKALLAPANPGLGRSIYNGKYYIHDKELAASAFADDPGHPCNTSDVLELLGTSETIETGYLNSRQALPEQGIFIAETPTTDSLKIWSGKINMSVLPAGAVEFFEYILQNRGYQKTAANSQEIYASKNILFVCGSKHENSRKAIHSAKESGAVVFYLPDVLKAATDQQLMLQWLRRIEAGWIENKRIILAVGNDRYAAQGAARNIEKVFAKVVKMFIANNKLDTLAIEGGETAQSICAELSITHFYPQTLLAPGVVLMKTGMVNPARIILKPGSYKWPDQLWSN